MLILMRKGLSVLQRELNFTEKIKREWKNKSFNEEVLTVNKILY